MIIHPSVLRLSKRLTFFLPIPGGVALITYLASLSHGVYPGYSAALTAAAAGLIPPSDAAHPLFALVMRHIVSWDVFSLPVRLNLFPAFCGTLCAMLLYHLVGRMILFSACEDSGGGARADLMDDEDEPPAIQPEEDQYNRRVRVTAVAGGLAAAFFFTFMASSWSAATRLDNGPFDLLLALIALSLFPVANAPGVMPRLALSSLVFVLGLFDSAAFLLLVPCYAYFLFRVFLFSRQRIVVICVLMAAGTMGLALSLRAFWMNMSDPSVDALWPALVAFARGMPAHHYHELQSFFPHTGWLLLLLQIGVPALLLLFGRQLLFKERRVSTLTALLLLTLAVVPGLLNLSFSPFFVFQTINHLPVFGAAVIAAAAASVIAACLIFVGPDDRQQEPEEEAMPEYPLWWTGVLRGCAGSLLLFFLLLAAIMPWRSFHDVDARRGAFADIIAREMLAAMKGRTWLVSNGYLENHLRIQALMRGQSLVMVSLRPQDVQGERERLSDIITSSPVFEGLNRQRLQNALSIGTVRFVTEWFTADTKAGSHAMVFAMPDIWTACGYRAIPEGFAFGGALPDQRLDWASVAEENRAFTEGLVPLLAGQDTETGYLAALRQALRMKAGFSMNELGVALEEMNEFEAAYQAYARASQIDPLNISAVVNGFAVAAAQKIHPEELGKLRKKIKEAMSTRDYRDEEITWILQNYGTIRQPAFYQQQAVVWSAAGARAVSTDKVRKALALSEQAGVSALVENAMVYAHAGDSAKAESCFLAALEKEASNKDALFGICTLMLTRRNTQGAEKWLQKALEAGIGSDVLLYHTITLDILKGDTDQALKLLKEATVKYPADLRYWTLEADILLKQGDAEMVEHTVLPEMQKAIKTPDHFLIHSVRGLLLRNKGPSHFKEARLSLLRALSLNAALPDIWGMVLELDMALGDKEFMEVHARNLLKIDPDHALANYLMGALLLKRGKLREAEDFLRRSIEKKPTAVACNDLGETLRLQKKLTEAEHFTRQALALNPGLLPALDTLACVLFDAGKVDESAQAAAKAVMAQPEQPTYQLTLLRAQVKLGDIQGVYQRLKSLEEAQASIPETLQREIKAMK